jgi:hypothetical protein
LMVSSHAKVDFAKRRKVVTPRKPPPFLNCNLYGGSSHFLLVNDEHLMQDLKISQVFQAAEQSMRVTIQLLVHSHEPWSILMANSSSWGWSPTQ